MHELMLIAAKLLPFENKLEMLEKDIAEYKADPSEVNKKNISTICLLIATEIAMEGKDISETMKDMDRSKRASELLDTKEN